MTSSTSRHQVVTGQFISSAAPSRSRRTSVVTALVSRLTAVTEPRLCALLPPPSQTVRLLPALTARHSALDTRGTTSSLIRHKISPEFSLSNTCTHHRR